MLPHSWEGTQRLELPVSSTTLKLWGGLPMVISEKSGGWVSVGHDHMIWKAHTGRS